MSDPLDCALDLMRRLPPSQIENNLQGLIDLLPDIVEDLLAAIDQPLKVAHDSSQKRDYLLCDYNRDGDSYRSPWSNNYDPQIKDGTLPSDQLREIEIEGNKVFDKYRELYFGGGVSSVYCWDLEEGFASVVLIKKTQDSSGDSKTLKGNWDSIHVVEVRESKGNATYKLTTTIMVTVETSSKLAGKISLSGNVTRQSETTSPFDKRNSHVINIGKAVEAMENKLRGLINVIYFSKTLDVINVVRQMIENSIIEKNKANSQLLTSNMNKDK
eukprot:TRINITY_DN2404_c0_g1_i1.p1 TRINITY_DN2404_c0_g1~~TRINITY_DN2404_c0_g1_i1.p1  ORF type:complete len:285 (+),score=76.65 TRINITY_DN2404_c0_g1_i1:44-856(+)